MENFDTITIQEMHKKDMLLILHALAYTAEHTNIKDFLNLKNDLIEELSALADIPSSEFLTFLEESLK